MTARERNMIEALLWTALAAACGTWCFLSWERGREAEAAAAKYRDRLTQLELAPRDDARMDERLAALRAEVGVEEARAAAAAATGVSEFGHAVRALLASNDIETLRYQTVRTDKGELLEFSCRGGARQFLTFLQTACAESRRWKVSFMSLRSSEGGEGVSAVFRISDD